MKTVSEQLYTDYGFSQILSTEGQLRTDIFVLY